MGSVYRAKYRDASTGELKETDTWYLTYSINGKRTQESSHSTIKADAINLLKRRLAEKRPADLNRLRFSDLRLRLVNHYKVNERRSLKRILQSFGNLGEYFRDNQRATKIDGAAVEQYITYRKEQGAANGTINRELTALKTAMKLAKLQPDFERLEEYNARKGFLEPAEYAALHQELPPYLKAVLECAYITGWRAREITTRRWENVDWDNGFLTIDGDDTKNRDARRFPFTPELRELLERQRKLNSAWVFASAKGGLIKQYNGTWARAAVKAGLSGKMLHDCRRSAARNLVRYGVAQSVAMKMMGHKTDEIFRRYAIVDEEIMREAAVKLAAGHAQENRILTRMTPGEVERLARTAKVAVAK
jgi:integrase